MCHDVFLFFLVFFPFHLSLYSSWPGETRLHRGAKMWRYLTFPGNFTPLIIAGNAKAAFSHHVLSGKKKKSHYKWNPDNHKLQRRELCRSEGMYLTSPSTRTAESSEKPNTSFSPFSFCDKCRSPIPAVTENEQSSSKTWQLVRNCGVSIVLWGVFETEAEKRGSLNCFNQRLLSYAELLLMSCLCRQPRRL